MEDIQVRIRDARKKLGWPQARLAKELGISREAVSFWENGKNHPDSERIGDLARVLKVSADWLWTGRGRPKATIPDPPIVGHVGAGAEVYPIDDHEPGAGLDIAELPPGEVLKEPAPPKSEVIYAGELPRNPVKDLPVYGSAEGGDGVMILDNEPIEYIQRPRELDGVRGAYAIYIVNDSMFPAYEPGDKLHVHPGKPLVPNKDALFIAEEPDGTRYAMVKRLVRVTTTAWKVQQFNPGKTFELHRSKWQKAHRIVGSMRAD